MVLLSINSRSVPSEPLQLRIETESPLRADVAALLATHTAFARSETPQEDAHALDPDDLLAPDITFFAARRAGELVAVGALRQLSPEHAEIKSMHTSASVRRQGVGEALLAHLITVARDRAYRRVSLETGAHPMFAPARALYAKLGFRPAPPFGAYRASPNSVYMTLLLEA